MSKSEEQRPEDIRSFDRVAPPYPDPLLINRNHDADEHWNGVLGQRVRCVPWPEGAPDPSTVPQAGEQVTRADDRLPTPRVFTVVNGIPRCNTPIDDKWRLQIYSKGWGTSYYELGRIRLYFEPEPERMYTEDEIRVALDTHGAFSAEKFLQDLRGA